MLSLAVLAHPVAMMTLATNTSHLGMDGRVRNMELDASIKKPPEGGF